MDEKRQILDENNNLVNKIGEMTFEIEKLKMELKNISSCFEVNSYSPRNSFGDFDNATRGTVNVKQLRQKIEELEDLITQYKNNNSPHKTIELEEAVNVTTGTDVIVILLVLKTPTQEPLDPVTV